MKILKTTLIVFICVFSLSFISATTVNAVTLQNNDPTADENNPEVHPERINQEQAARDRAQARSTAGGCEGLVCCDGPDCDFSKLILNIEWIIKQVLKLAFVFIAVMFAYAGFKYMTSQGDTGQIQAAHDMFKNAAVGMIVTLCAFLIIELITSTLGLDESIIKLVK